MLKIVIMTQEDRFFIPQNIQKIINNSDVKLIVNVNAKSSLNNKLKDFIDWFGLIQVAKMGIRTINARGKSILDKLSNYKVFKGNNGIKDVATYNNIDYLVIEDSNSEKFIKKIKDIKPDLILSFSAPQIIKADLLSIPKYGILNVHGSLLPDYRGCLPSFWYLYNNENIGGATVHKMSSKIDDGDILVQREIDISNINNMFELIQSTKKLGGDLMVDAIKLIESGNFTYKKNEVDKGRYFTWPTKHQAKEFRRKGKKLI